jgi:hypothetical protein
LEGRCRPCDEAREAACQEASEGIEEEAQTVEMIHYVNLQVSAGPWWEPNVAEHWVFWLIVGAVGFSSIVVAGWIRRRLAQQRRAKEYR